MLGAASNATSHLTDGGHALSDKKVYLIAMCAKDVP